MTEVKAKWTEGMQFVARADSGHAIVMDTVPQVGGMDTSIRPMELLLVGLAGCTGMDVISILRKMRVEFDNFEVLVKAEKAPQHPKVYTKIDLEYLIWGKEIPEDMYKKAINLSQEKYCSASVMLGRTAQLSYSYRINPES
jgi:putative redox protein